MLIDTVLGSHQLRERSILQVDFLFPLKVSQKHLAFNGYREGVRGHTDNLGGLLVAWAPAILGATGQLQSLPTSFVPYTRLRGQ